MAQMTDRAGIEPVAVIDDPAAAEVSLDPMRARLLAALAEPGSASTLAAEHRAGPAEDQLPPARAGAARPGRTGRGAPAGQLHRTRAARHRRLLRDLTGRAGLGGAGPGPGPGPAVRPVAARPGGPAGPRGRRADHPVPGGRPAGGHVRHRQRDPVRARPPTGPSSPGELSETIKDLAARYHNESAPRAERRWRPRCTRASPGRGQRTATGSIDPPAHRNDRSSHGTRIRDPARGRAAGHPRAGLAGGRHRRRHGGLDVPGGRGRAEPGGRGVGRAHGDRVRPATAPARSAPRARTAR